MSSVLIQGGSVVRRDGDRQEVSRADVLVRGNTIAAIMPASTDGPPTDPGTEIIDATGRLVLPGLANMHTHSYANLFRGRFDRLPLEAWVPYATATTLGRTRREGYLSALLGAVDSLRTGTTLVLDHLAGTPEAKAGALEAYRDVGLRVAMSPMVADLPAHTTVPLQPDADLRADAISGVPPPPSAAEIVDEFTDMFATWHSADGPIHVLLGPSGPQRCSEELLTACADLSERFNTGVHTHLLESRVQAAGARSTPDGSLVTMLDRLGLLTDRFSGAHGVWCSPEELDLLGERGATLVHNPWSNLTLGSGHAPIEAWQRAGVTRALGTDGANCGGNLDMFRAMGLATILRRPDLADPSDWPAVSDAVTMATEGAARCAQWEGRLGRLEPGQLADIIVCDLDPVTHLPGEGLLGSVIHGGLDGGVRHVLVDGRRVLIDGRIPGIDLAALGEEAREAVERIEVRNAALFRAADAQRDAMLQLARQHHQ
jgi:cytosine/adenosine deaminase-related metal-dependent hydrolase